MSEPVSLADQIACVERELAMRGRVYPAWVAKGKMKQAKADQEMAAIRAVLATLQRAEAAERERDALREALNTYGKHHQGCDMYQSFKRETGRCHCGLSDALVPRPPA